MGHRRDDPPRRKRLAYGDVGTPLVSPEISNGFLTRKQKNACLGRELATSSKYFTFEPLRLMTFLVRKHCESSIHKATAAVPCIK